MCLVHRSRASGIVCAGLFRLHTRVTPPPVGLRTIPTVPRPGQARFKKSFVTLCSPLPTLGPAARACQVLKASPPQQICLSLWSDADIHVRYVACLRQVDLLRTVRRLCSDPRHRVSTCRRSTTALYHYQRQMLRNRSPPPPSPLVWRGALCLRVLRGARPDHDVG